MRKMTNYWLCVIDDRNWRIVNRHNIWGVRGRFHNTISGAKVGDRLVFYVKPLKIGGVFEATSDPYEDHELLFGEKGASDLYPFRIRLRKVIIPEEALPFKQVIPKLEFIKNKRKWGGYLQGRAMIPISEYDYKIIETALT